jgi:hypothetical protein
MLLEHCVEEARPGLAVIEPAVPWPLLTLPL